MYCEPCKEHGLSALPMRVITKTLEEIILACCYFLKEDRKDILSDYRERHLAEKRHLLMACLVNNTRFTKSEISRKLNRNHASVINAHKKIESWICVYPEIKGAYNNLSTFINDFKYS